MIRFDLMTCFSQFEKAIIDFMTGFAQYEKAKL
jgi:hypothetical protein